MSEVLDGVLTTPREAAEAFRQATMVAASVRRRALEDPVLFMASVLRDEETGLPVVPALFHEEWQDLITEHERLVLWAAIEHGKTWEISIGRVLYELARNPSMRIAIVSNTYLLAMKVIRHISQMIQSSPELHQVAPELRPAASGSWTATAITVERPFASKDPSIQACGVHGNIMGSRIDLLVLDDVLDWEIVRTKDQRQQLEDWYRATLVGRLTRSSRVIAVGTAWDNDDLLHKLARQPRWFSKAFPASDRVTGARLWPERFSVARLEQRREELGPLEAARQLDCRPRTDSEQRFKQAYVERCKARGEGRRMAHQLRTTPPGYRVFTGVDLAVQEKDKNDETAFVTVAVAPNGDRELLCVEGGRWGGPVIVQKILEHHHRYQGIFVVENNAAQDYIIQFTHDRAAIPILPYTTGRTKAHPEFGVEKLATEMSNGKWVIPNDGGVCHPEVEKLLDDMLFYTPTTHTGDRLMACWFVVEGERLLAAAQPPHAGTTRIDTLRR